VVLPTLEAFQQAAQKGDWVHVGYDGAQWEVLATGATPSPRSVALMPPEADSTAAFVGALSRSFSADILAAVVAELGLGPAPGQPLSSRTVIQAIDMAQTSRLSLDGVDFLTRLTVSTVNNPSGFQAACVAEGLSEDAFDASQRAAIDVEMKKRFDAAGAAGSSHVPQVVAQGWLREELRARRRGHQPLT
jgi:hypothetical protein